MSSSSRAATSRRGRRLIAGLATAAVGFALAAEDTAMAGEYTVVQCAGAHRGYDDARFERTNGGDYGFGKHCEEAGEGNSLQVKSITSTPSGRSGQIAWLAPAGTWLVGVDVQARLRRDAGHRARLVFLGPGGVESGLLASGTDDASGFTQFSARPSGGRAGFAAQLSCEERAGCPQSDQARTWVRELRITLRDDVPPTVALSGSLFDPGWRRGRLSLAGQLSDVGSGLRSVSATVNGGPVGLDAVWGCAIAPGTAFATRLQPCTPSRGIAAELDTARAPFANGTNLVRVCGRDFGASPLQGCAQRSVLVDNAAPTAAFSGPPATEDPELIKAVAGDAHSGLATASIAYQPLAGGPWRALPTQRSGSALSARVDSAREPAGRYLFQITATDLAGNATASSRRLDGEEMVLEFPLKTATSASGAVAGPAKVGYGERPMFSGMLRAARGPAPAGQTVLVSERFDPGSTPAVLNHEVRTDQSGHFELQLSAGPSRQVVVSYPGSLRYQPSSSQPSRLTVGGQAGLKLSARRVRAGRRVRFEGSVGHLGAAVPVGGKLVELQAREGGKGRYRTVRQAVRTDGNGRLLSSYRFGRFYSAPTVYRFRLKVTPESGWPYRAPTFSPARRLKVMPR